MLEGGAPGSARRVREARRRGRRVLAGVAVLALLVAAVLLVRPQAEPPGEPVPGAASAERAAPAAPEPRAQSPAGAPAPAGEPALPDEPLPALEQSDAFVRERVAALSALPEFEEWLLGEGLIERFVAAVDAVANGESPRAHLAELRPRDRFQPGERGGRPVADERSWSRYDVATGLFASIDARAYAALHRLLLPLFEQAYGQLGRREGSFDDVLTRAFRELLAEEVPESVLELEAKVRSYALADPLLEARSPAQKHLLRMGPQNARRVQAKLRELAAALGYEL
jgi:hypothetical protein